jgi:raffinose/stachyose/melibiose transport system substrate-binding protein
MRKVKKTTVLLLIVIFLLTLLAACRKDPAADTQSAVGTEEGFGGASSDKNPVTLVTVSMMGGTDPNTDNYNEVNAQFITDYPYITIEDESQVADQDWRSKIAADFAVGNEPDVIQYFTDANASDVLAAGKFVTVAEIIAVYPDYAKDTLPAALAAAANPDGVSRAVPTTGYWEGLFCNKDLFDRYRLELPTDWNKLLKAINTFRAYDIIPIAVSLNHVPHYWIEYLMLSAAGPQGYTTVPDVAPTDWIAGLETFKTLRDLGAFPADTDTVDNDYISELFKTKQAAMQLDGSWYANGITDQENTVVCSFPVIPGGKAEPGFMIGGISSGFYITKKAWEDPDKRDAAVKFVMAHTCKDNVTKYWNGNGQAAVAADPIEGMTPLGITGLNYSNAATSISAPTDSRISAEAYSALVAGIIDISTGARTAEEVLIEVLKLNAR